MASIVPENGPVYGAIGEAIIEQVGSGHQSIWAYFEVGDGWVDESVFIDHGDHAEWIEADDSIAGAVVAAWESEPKGRRWQGMEYRIDNGRFATRLTYADQFDPNSSTSDRVVAIRAKHFGTKEIRYPAL